jgi:threonine dehydratase
VKPISLEDIECARATLRGRILRTPNVAMRRSDVVLKAESLQHVGAFKLRGAINVISGLSPQELSCGVVASSSGNHAQAVAYAAKLFATHAVIVMPRTARQYKIDATRAHGAEIVFVESIDDAAAVARDLEMARGLVRVAPFDDERVIAANATIALEIIEDLPAVDAITVPIGGGGLIAGIAAAVKAAQPSIRVIGVEPENSAAASASLRMKQLVTLDRTKSVSSVADGLVINRIGEITWQYIRTLVDHIVCVSEAEILTAVRTIAIDGRLTSEPSGAASVAAWLFHRHELPQASCPVAIVSGGNTQADVLGESLRGA